MVGEYCKISIFYFGAIFACPKFLNGAISMIEKFIEHIEEFLIAAFRKCAAETKS